jgi:hydrogenase-4 component H
MSRLKAYSELIMNFFRKPVTVKESFAFMADTFRWLPRRDADKCTGCGACNERCSSGATSIKDNGDQRLISIDSYNCIFCGRCADACPEKALELSFEAKTEQEKKERDALLAKACKTDAEQCTWCLDDSPEAQQRYMDKISLSQGSEEKKVTTDTTMKLQHCSMCGNVMPATEKYLQVIRERTLKNLQPETAAGVEKDMEKYLTACIDCRRKYSLEWDTHPRKWI